MTGAIRRLAEPLDAVCLDLDGTLLDTAPDLAAASNAMLVDLGRPPLAEATVATFVGKGVDRLVRRCLEATGGGADDAALFADARARWDLHYGRLNGRYSRLYPGVTEGLAALAAQGFELGCITNKPGAFVPPLLDAFGLGRWFRFWIAGDTVDSKKPAPGQLLEAARRLGIVPARIAMVGDSVNDALAARAAGMRVYLLPYGYNEGRPIADVDSDGVVPSVAALAEAIAAVRPAPAQRHLFTGVTATAVASDPAAANASDPAANAPVRPVASVSDTAFVAATACASEPARRCAPVIPPDPSASTSRRHDRD